ncbi:MAG TPA: PPOX class F420-dependent oxidoreductase [Anaerolineales bacterium]|nr:PPOX class F420-dependent oxidoreductase [Anaerolineales bacterium]
MSELERFAKKNYLNLETFRKTGIGVKTPVWFVLDGELLYVSTVATSGKVKRIHNDGRANVAPCRMDGTPTGPWVPARVSEITDPVEDERINRLLDKKYGWLKKLFDGQRARHGAKDTVLEIALEKSETA